MLAIKGAGFEGVLIDTLSNVAVVRLEVVPLLTPNPTYTFCAIVIVWFVPVCVQMIPSDDRYALNVFPLRTNFIQNGNVLPPPAWLEVLPSVLVR
jgi:hypothetical protein